MNNGKPQYWENPMEISGVGAPVQPTIGNPAPPSETVQAQLSQPNAQPPGPPDGSGRGQTTDVQA